MMDPAMHRWSCLPCSGWCGQTEYIKNHSHNDEVIEKFDAYRIFASVVLPGLLLKRSFSPLKLLDLGEDNLVMNLVADFAGVPKPQEVRYVLNDLQQTLKWIDIPDEEKMDRIKWRNQNKNLKPAQLLECTVYYRDERNRGIRQGYTNCWWGKKRRCIEISS